MGDNSTSSTSVPLTAEQRTALFTNARSLLGSSSAGGVPEGNAYESAGYIPYGEPQSLSGQDYNALEDSIRQSKYAGIDRAWDRRKQDINQDAADRGIWSSGVPTQVMQNEFESSFAPQYASAASDAATQRYNLQSGEDQMLNNYRMQQGNAQNAYNQTEAQRVYESKWRPADYWSGVYNGTGGAVSSSTGGGWSI